MVNNKNFPITIIVLLAGLIVGLGIVLVYYNRSNNYSDAIQEAIKIAREGKVTTSSSSSSNTTATRSEFLEMSAPEIVVSELHTDLDIPWDIEFFPDGNFLLSERVGRLWVGDSNILNQLDVPEDIYAKGEGGLMGLAIDPRFAETRYIFACFNSDLGEELDVRVARWTLSIDNHLATRTDIITGIPATSSGRHSGCQLEFGPQGYLWIGTGDAATGETPQSPQSLGGKILRVDVNGDPHPENVTQNDIQGSDPRVYSVGHRNTQGIDFFSDPLVNIAGEEVFGVSVEHGPDVDDELNPLLPGNFGWNPIPFYNESVPMTDLDLFPEAISAIWSSGEPTLGTSDVEVIEGEEWQGWNGAVAIASLAGERVKIVRVSDNAEYVDELDILTEYGRIRSIEQAPDGSLFVLTANGKGEDRLLRVGIE